MHLKSLTLKGFKSFASATTLNFEPGITCVVGPNGSGKSNVIDAVAWVLGEQGARSLRGGSMADVIFAGTTGRAPLGRAEVSLTIDNADGAVPIPHAEITLTRTMFRGGGSEYAINGSPARLLDVVELLSDAGVGREMHVIVGQNSLDTVLAGNPMDRRGLLEEAAGVLKHRKRKEKALRKLEAMQANFTRIQDLTAEVRRQLTPLGRQAEAAQKAAVLQAQLRDATLRLLADDLVRGREQLAVRAEAEAQARSRREEFERELTELRTRERDAEETVAGHDSRFRAAAALASSVATLRERYRGTAALAAERRRTAEEVRDADAGTWRDPEELEREAEAATAQEAELRESLERNRADLTTASRTRQESEAALAEAEKAAARVARAAADAREQRARWAGQVATVRGRIETREAELVRLTETGEAARARAASFRERAADLAGQASAFDEGEAPLREAYEAAEGKLAQLEERVAELRTSEREAERARAAAGARAEALRLALASRASADLVNTLPPESMGPRLADVLTVTPGYETAIAAALGTLAEAATVPDLSTAVTNLALVRAADAGGATFVVLGGGAEAPATPMPEGCRPALEVVVAEEPYRGVLRRMLHRTAVAETGELAAQAVSRRPDLTVVTLDGDVVDAHAVRGASSGPSALELQAAATEAEQREAEAAGQVTARAAQKEQAESEVAAARAAVNDALAKVHAADASQHAVTEQLAQWRRSAEVAESEADRAEKSREAAATALAKDREELPALEQRLAAVESDDNADDAVAELPDRDELAQACVTARQVEVDSRLVVRVTEERIAVEVRRREAAQRVAEQERQARRQAEERRRRAVRELAVATEVGRGVQAAMLHVERIAAEITRGLSELESAREEGLRILAEVRERLRAVATEAEAFRAADGGGEVSHIEARLRLEALEARSREEFALEPPALIEEFGPDRPVDAEDEPRPYVRAEQEERRAKAEKRLSSLGKVNPLALEEFAALEERHKFLSSQLEDLKATRKDLLGLVDEVDAKVQEIFADAFADTAAAFERVFARLFPGGEGRLILTDPDDPIATGIEVEARPPGKRVKRLSLLSGGERSLTALAFLVALFQARPSPFYILDEVEAALDDVNLGRLLGLFEELRESSQLIVITHQKRTMEIADALYGVTMRGDGVSAVIGQRLRESEAV